MDRGVGLFAGLNVLPKAAWFSSYSSSITREMNISFLKSLYLIRKEEGLLSDTVNIDFTAIPYWGDDDPFENNWSPVRFLLRAPHFRGLDYCIYCNLTVISKIQTREKARI
ncbi:MAG: hypothetical protein HPY74_09715 [Firmicutes bacterium]|nr:hypothetical protein [Bacillota bacterium]